MKLTATQRAIAENMNIAVHELESRMSDNDPDDDTESQSPPDELDAALDHLGASEPGDDDHLDHVTAARDCLNSYLARNGGEVKDSMNSAGLVFPHHRRSV
jgi:hypothetical protein